MAHEEGIIRCFRDELLGSEKRNATIGGMPKYCSNMAASQNLLHKNIGRLTSIKGSSSVPKF